MDEKLKNMNNIDLLVEYGRKHVELLELIEHGYVPSYLRDVPLWRKFKEKNMSLRDVINFLYNAIADISIQCVKGDDSCRKFKIKSLNEYIRKHKNIEVYNVSFSSSLFRLALVKYCLTNNYPFVLWKSGSFGRAGVYLVRTWDKVRELLNQGFELRMIVTKDINKLCDLIKT